MSKWGFPLIFNEMSKVKNRMLVRALVLAGMACLWVASVSARMLRDVKTQSSQVPPAYRVTATCLPNKDQCTHKVGRLWFTITNYGFFGNQTNTQGLRDCLTGGPSSSAEFPGGSEIEYLYQGALWVGAVVGGDTLTSIGTDGWVFDAERGELHADCEESGAIIRRSRNQGSPYYDPVNGVSDLDLIAVMYDTLTDPAFVENPDPQDGKPFRPMGLKVIQSSYSWSAGWGQDWVMLDYKIVNLGRRPLTQVYIGVFVDADVGHPDRGFYAGDDLSGFKLAVPNETNPACPDTINLVYVQDQDGDPTGDAFTRTSPTAVSGIRVVRAPIPLNQVKTSFNWWTPNGTVSLDWGPQKVPARKNSAGGLGQPEGDAMKYFYLSNGENDLDQVWCALNHNTTNYGFGTGWQPPLTDPGAAVDIANGFDTRYVVGYGPFNLKSLVDDPSDTLRLTFGYIAGQGFHQNPLNFSSNLGTVPENFRNPGNIERYQQGLNFTSIATNARWVQRVFDNEDLIDTNYVCGEPPDTIARRVGDGIPDFKGPQPPPAPLTQVITDQGEITLRWFGKNSETVTDEFTGQPDFEGYRVQMSHDNQNFTVIGSFDKVDWKLYYLDRSVVETTGTFGTWKPTSYPPMSWDEIQRRFAVLKANPAKVFTPPYIVGWDTCQNILDTITGQITIGHPINPYRFKAPTSVRGTGPGFWPLQDPSYCNPDTSKTSFRVSFGRSRETGLLLDTMYYCVPQDYNLGLSQAKLYPSVTDPANDSSYWYQYRISGLSPASPVYLAITPFDYGLLTKSNTLDPLEATPTSASQLIYPLPNEASRRYSYRVYAREVAESWSNAPMGIMNFNKIQETYAGRWDTCRQRVINPETFNAPDNPAPDPTRCNPDTLRRAISVRFCDNCGPGGSPVDSQFYFVLSDTFKISVYPNPYRVDHDYSHFENPGGVVQDADRHRILNFINLPAKCKIRIYTLDGDLVQEINHDKNPAASDAGYERWDLLTRNAQIVSAGLYMYTVQSADGIWTEDGLKNTYVGKIIIIK
jgi:hypothetical protein